MREGLWRSGRDGVHEPKYGDGIEDAGRLAGTDSVFLHACGDFIEFYLQQGQSMKVDTGSVVGGDVSIEYDIQKVPGIKTMFFGGEGFFITTLTGPGKIIIQSMTLHNLAAALSPFLPHESRTSGAASVVGGLLDGALRNR